MQHRRHAVPNQLHQSYSNSGYRGGHRASRSGLCHEPRSPLPHDRYSVYDYMARAILFFTSSTFYMLALSLSTVPLGIVRCVLKHFSRVHSCNRNFPLVESKRRLCILFCFPCSKNRNSLASPTHPWARCLPCSRQAARVIILTCHLAGIRRSRPRISTVSLCVSAVLFIRRAPNDAS